MKQIKNFKYYTNESSKFMDDGSFRIRENLTFSLAEVNNIKHMFEEIAKEFNLNKDIDERISAGEH